MIKRTPYLALAISVIMMLSVKFIFEVSERPFTTGQNIILYILSLAPSVGIALFFDPKAAKNREELLKINFYEEN
ncbi:MAG: hypothetical protein SVR08_17975 [Spirochaetota bacterium]|nr:hypothetical protein [Spirochaetota bacterium]